MHKSELEMLAKKASSQFLEHGTSLDESILQVSSSHSLNDEQTKRVVEMTNVFVNGHLVKEAKSSGKDPRLTFKMASMEGVKKLRGVEPTFSDDAVAKVASMFTVSGNGRRRGTDVDMQKIADVQADTEPQLSRFGGDVLAQAYLGGPTLAGHAFTLEAMTDAVEIIDGVIKEAAISAGGVANDIESLERELKNVIETEIHAGVSAASLKHVAGEHAKVASVLVDDVRVEMGLSVTDDGVNQVTDKTIVFDSHPYSQGLKKLAALRVLSNKIAAVSAAAKVARAAAAADVADARKSTKTAFMPKRLGASAGGTLGAAMNVAGSVGAGRESTARLKAKQMTPAVGPMKMAGMQEAMFAGLAGAAVALGAGVVARGLDVGFTQIGKAFKNRKEQELFAELVRQNPDFGRNPRAREAFDIISKFAPGLLKSPRVVSDFMARQLQYPQSSIEFMKQLADFQKVHREGMAKGPGLGTETAKAFASGFGQGMSGKRGG